MGGSAKNTTDVWELGGELRSTGSRSLNRGKGRAGVRVGVWGGAKF